ncbi:MAG: ATP-binding protein [Fibromonadaceae bacterium]|jgi:predicted AAA+ superfamily ATPase|nr:ATP-binding protein [Fibromonadaceae bacterium]
MQKPVYNRAAYTGRIEAFIEKNIVKVLTGHRRVGKSRILYLIMEKIKKNKAKANIIYINKEDIAFDAIRSYHDLNNYIAAKSVKNKMNYIFIDEVQLINDFHITIKSLLLKENNDIYITGSNSDMLSSDLANELGGRYIEFTIHSLSYIEFLQFHKLENDDASLEKYIRYGGLPYLIHLPFDNEVIREYLNSIYSTIILKEVVARKKIRNTIFLEQLVKYLAGNIGNLFSSKSISDFLKNQRTEISPNQVIEYISALTDAFVIHKVGRYDIIGKKMFERGEKYYFEDMGIRNMIAGYKPQDRAMRLENLVFNHLLFCGYDVKVGVLQAEEVDFVCSKNGEKLYVQVTQELSKAETIDREFGNLLKIRDNYPKVVVSADVSFENTYEGVQHVYIRDFLSI